MKQLVFGLAVSGLLAACGGDKATGPLASVAGTWSGDIWGGTATFTFRDTTPPYLVASGSLVTRDGAAVSGATHGPNDAAYSSGHLTASLFYAGGFVTLDCQMDKRNRCVGTYRENALYSNTITLARR